jgi:hypothetical protein
MGGSVVDPKDFFIATLNSLPLVNKHVILKGSFVAVFYHCMFDSFLIELFY